MIQANCRAQLTSNDFRFVVETLSRKSGDQSSLAALTGDPAALDELLDNDSLLDAILTRQGCIGISSTLYFYVIARRVLRNAGIEDRAVADYLGSLLAEFSHAQRMHSLSTRPGQQFEYISDLLAVIGQARAEEVFVVRAHIGNYTLFLTGVFPQHLAHRARFKGAPDLDFYEGVGSQNFRLLSDHDIARRKQLSDVFNCLGEQFHEVRIALNDMSERLLTLDKPDADLDAMLATLPPGSR